MITRYTIATAEERSQLSATFQPHHSQFSDREIERRVESFLESRNDKHAGTILVEASAGRVLLRGTVGSHQQRDQLESHVRRVAGVNYVINLLRVAPLGALRSAPRRESVAFAPARGAERLLPAVGTNGRRLVNH